MTQLLLLPDPRPLVERLGRDFFREAPERPGVYLMRDAGDAVLYVGKAKNLRKRLGSYRVANPDRLPRRHLRLLRSVARIEIQVCPDESSALARESELLHELKPKFNRAGTWPASSHCLAWRRTGDTLELAIKETPKNGWLTFGRRGRAAVFLRAALVRLLWVAMHPDRGFVGLPTGWAQGRFEGCTIIASGAKTDEVSAFVGRLLSGEVDAFSEWMIAQLGTCPFERTAVTEDLDALKKIIATRPSPVAS